MKPEQLTAWALNELSPVERAQIEAQLKAAPASAQQAAEVQAFCNFLTEHLVPDEAALTDEQRREIEQLDLSGTVVATDVAGVCDPGPATPASHDHSRWNGASTKLAAHHKRHATGVTDTGYNWPMRIAALAACIGFVGFVMFQAGQNTLVAPKATVADATSVRVQMKSEKPTATFDLLKDAKPQPLVSMAPVPPLPINELSKLANPSLANATVPADTKAFDPLPPGTVQPTPDFAKAMTSPAPPPPLVVGAESKLIANNGAPLVLGKSPDSVDEVLRRKKTKALTSIYLPPFTPTATLTGTPSNTVAKGGSGLVIIPPSLAMTTETANTTSGGSLSPPDAATATLNVGTVTLSGTNAPSAQPAKASRSKTALTGGATASTSDKRLEELRRQRVGNFDPPPIPASRSNTEGYAAIIENRFLQPNVDPLSTFSIDVDTASYANVRRFLNHNALPPPDAVRIEELINYFPYNYEPPAKDAAQPFAVQIDVTEAPWEPTHRLARIGIKGRELGEERKAANFVFLIDVSGSMNEPDKLPLVQRSLAMLTSQLKNEDRVAIVTYAGDTRVALESTAGKNKAAIHAVIDALQSGGGTNGASGIQLAYAEAQKQFLKEGINRVILCTDGDFNVGVSSAEELEKLIKKQAESGVFLSVLGFGTGNLQDHKMETLADKGNGNYAYIDSLAEARKVLVQQMNGTLVTIAKDVKIQVEFNPTQVRAYRLLGYENRALANADFNNDRKDAGEIGAGHTVTALYEIVPMDAPLPEDRPLVDDLKYQPKAKAPEAPMLTGVPPQKKLEGINDEVMTVKLRYKEPDGELSKLIEQPVRDTKSTLKDAPRDLKFAAAAAGFGLLLRDSEHKGKLTWETVRKLAIQGKGEDKEGQRGEFIQLIDKAAGLSGQP